MKKNYLLIALCIICAIFASCTSKDEKTAVEYLKSTLKSPSSFKKISVEVTPMESFSTYDTLYRISKVYDHYFYSLHEYDSIVIDSIKIMRTDYPAHQFYAIEYDAANSYGAIIRDTELIVMYEGVAYSNSEFIEKFSDSEVVDHVEAYSTTIVPRYPNENDMKEGNWLNLLYFGIY